MNYHYKVLGVKRLDFTTDSGDRINGCQLWVLAPTSDSAWLGGMEVFKLWSEFGSALFDQVCALRTGDEISGECDRKGRPLTIVKKAA